MLGVAVGSASAETDSQAPTFEQVAQWEDLTVDHANLFRLYWAFFNRPPDPPGALYWLDQYERCAPLASIVDWFAQGSEFAHTYGRPNDTEFLTLLYRNVFGREPDAPGAAYWLSGLGGGSLTRTEAVLYFSLSSEFVAAHPLPSDARPGRPCRPYQRRATDRPRTYAVAQSVVFAHAGGVAVWLPSIATEHVGYHQSVNRGAQSMVPLDGAVHQSTLPNRGRGTGSRTAADVAVHPMAPILAPASGTVIRAGTYRLYCHHHDEFVVISPDDRPGFEVTILHIQGLGVVPGDRVQAGQTVLARRARVLPFVSQIDRVTAPPAWPHVHIEVTDPTIPNEPGTGGGC